MGNMIEIITVGLGGFVGAVCRYLISLIPLNEAFLFPIKTFMINIAGCIFIGLVTVCASMYDIENTNLILFLKAGVCGGFTTFSTFALETSTLIKSGHSITAFMYIFLSVLVGVVSVFSVQYCLDRFTI